MHRLLCCSFCEAILYFTAAYCLYLASKVTISLLLEMKILPIINVEVQCYRNSEASQEKQISKENKWLFLGAHTCKRKKKYHDIMFQVIRFIWHFFRWFDIFQRMLMWWRTVNKNYHINIQYIEKLTVGKKRELSYYYDNHKY